MPSPTSPRRVTRRVPGAAVLAVAATVLLASAACSDGSGDGGASTAPSPSTATPAPSTTAPSASATPSSDPGPSASGADAARGIPTTSEIEVVEVRGGCVYVTTPEGDRWALRGGDVDDLVIGERVRVTGAADDTEYAECPDGAPFLVSEVLPLR